MSIINPISPSMINKPSEMASFSTTHSSSTQSANTLDAMMSAAVANMDGAGGKQVMSSFTTSPSGTSSDGVLNAVSSMVVDVDKAARMRDLQMANLDPTNSSVDLLKGQALLIDKSATFGAFKKGMTLLETGAGKLLDNR